MQKLMSFCIFLLKGMKINKWIKMFKIQLKSISTADIIYVSASDIIAVDVKR